MKNLTGKVKKMGQCGCGNFRGILRFKAPGNKWYFLQIYDSCDYCHTGAGIILYQMSQEEMKDFDAQFLPEIEIKYEGIGIPVIDPVIFQDLATDYFTDIFGNLLTNSFKDSIWKTVHDWKRKNFDNTTEAAGSRARKEHK